MASTSRSVYAYTRLGVGGQNRASYVHTPSSSASSITDLFCRMGERNGRPYFGMTGTMLNVWVTVACTTAMTLFGEMLPAPIAPELPLFIKYIKVMIRVFLAVLSSLRASWRRWGIRTQPFKGLSFLYTTSGGRIYFADDILSRI